MRLTHTVRPVPERGIEASAAAVATPQNVRELSEVVQEAAESHSTIYIQGGGTHKAFSNIGPDTDGIVSLAHLREVIEYSPVDLTLAVETGVTLAQIDNLLAEKDQRLALDMPHREDATIGGTFAAGLSGPRRFQYGSLKDMVIGLEVVNQFGAVTKSGGMVVKNVSGYELARLHYGAHGAFGIVSRVNLKVLPAVASRLEIIFQFENPSAALQVAREVLVSSFDASAVYVVLENHACWTTHVQLEGSSQFTSMQSKQIIDAVTGDIQPLNVQTNRIDGNSTPHFDRIVDLHRDDTILLARFSVPASKQEDFIARLDPVEPDHVLIDSGSGLVYLRCTASSSNVDALKKLREPVAYLSLPEYLKNGVDVFGKSDRVSKLIVERLKDQYDPGRMFNPGRFVDNL